MPGSAPPHPAQHQGQQYGAPGSMHAHASACSRPTSQYGAIHYSPQLAPQQIRHSPSPVPLSQSQMRRENSYRTNSLNQLDNRGGYADHRTSYITGQTPISSVLTAEPILAVAGNSAPNLGSIRRHGGSVSDSIGYSGTPPQQQQQQQQMGNGPGSIRRRDQAYGGGQRDPVVQQPPMPPVSQNNSMSTLVNSMGNMSLQQSQPGAGLAYAHQQPRNDQSLHSLTMSVPAVGSHLQSSQATLNNYSPRPPPVSHSQSTFAISTASAVSVPVSSIHSAPLVNHGMSIHSTPDLLHASGSSPVASVQGGCGSTMAYPLWMNMQANCFHAYQHHIPVLQSNFSGTKHALIIGINYYNKEYSQTSNINSAHAIRGMLIKRFGYNEKNVVLLSDDQDDPRSHPTHHLITTAIKRMMRNVQANDSVFFYFCGFGRLPVQVLDKRSEQILAIRRLRSDFILPIDFEAAGAIDSAYLKKYLVRQLHQSAHLTAIFNCIVNDTGLDVPYKYINPNGTAVVTNAIAGSNLFEAGMKINPGSNASFSDLDLSQRFETSFMQQYSQNSLGSDAAAAEMSRIKDSTGDIVVFGWDRDYSNPKHKNYLSHTPGNQLGAFWAAAMESTLKSKPKATYGEVLAYLQSSCKKIVMMPFIASGRKIEMNEEFEI
ncbi:Ca(2+)-dependent cysteine protease [Coemansia interrupta]|uniref:Ca(2+)-dependent cysteine protease n=1 Tax=Coemansia interrupta TaxID=1126814 RepID=A0A9W8LMF7_9FUNG|nr:Ca(2+)-dependent cysteine protease [Coemansia interrupta]